LRSHRFGTPRLAKTVRRTSEKHRPGREPRRRTPGSPRETGTEAAQQHAGHAPGPAGWRDAGVSPLTGENSLNTPGITYDNDNYQKEFSMNDLIPTTYPQPTGNPVICYLATLGSEKSRRSMLAALEIIADLATTGRCNAYNMPWYLLRPQHTAAVRAALAERYNPTSANHKLAALRSVLRQCWRLGLLDAETYARCADLPAVKGSALPRGRMLSLGEMRTLFETCAEDHSTAGRRDAALITVLAGAGLRRAEIVALDMADFDAETGALTVRSGKGRKARITYAANGCLLALEQWLEIRGTEPGPLFCPVSKGGQISLRRMTDQAVYIVLRKRGKQASPLFSQGPSRGGK